MLTNGALRDGRVPAAGESVNPPFSAPPLLSLSTCQTALTWIWSLGVGCVGGHWESQRWYGVLATL